MGEVVYGETSCSGHCVGSSNPVRLLVVVSVVMGKNISVFDGVHDWDGREVN